MTNIDSCIIYGLVCSFTVLISACAAHPVSESSVKYECNRGTVLSADFSTDGKFVNISTEDVENLQLPAIPSDSGFIYSNGRYELSGKGKEAIWSIGRMASENCIAK
ncbi:MAG: MliC family protein [Nitrosomonadales bacterium]|nr:MliC family protein [Nitrosomonadales bacterium]